MKKCLSFILTMICIFGLVGCHNSPRVSENSGQYQVYLKSDIRTEVLSSTSASDEELNIFIKLQATEGPESVFMELWIRSGEEAKWDLLDSKTLFLSDSIACDIPAGHQYMVHISKVDGSNGNITLAIEKK